MTSSSPIEAPVLDAVDLPFRSATDLTAAIRAKTISSRELLDVYLSRLEAINPAVNAIVTVDAEVARTRAGEADEAMARGDVWGPLTACR